MKETFFNKKVMNTRTRVHSERSCFYLLVLIMLWQSTLYVVSEYFDDAVLLDHLIMFICYFPKSKTLCTWMYPGSFSFQLSKYIDRVPYFSKLTKTTVSHLMQIWQLCIIHRHPVTILVTAFTITDKFDLWSPHSQTTDITKFDEFLWAASMYW